MQWYLLEHAFQTLLEGGEIPDPLFFLEMLIEATSQSNYEKAVTLVNTMALAPFQVSENQWTELFEENEDRIAQGSLEKLLDALSNCELSSEITASNLLRSLQSLCKSALSKCSRPYCSDATGESEPNGNSGETYGSERLNIPSISSDAMNEETNNAAIYPPVRATDVPFAVFSANHNVKKEEAGGDADSIHRLSDYDRDNSVSKKLAFARDFSNDIESGEPSKCLGKQVSFLNLDEYMKDVDDEVDDDEAEMDLLINEDDDPHTSKLPSAHEILQSWEESRKKDGIFLPFYFGQK